MRNVLLRIFVLLAFVMIAAIAARAEPLPVDRGRIYKDLAVEKPDDVRPPQAEVGVSTWRPRKGDYADFGTQTVPQLSLRFIVPGFSGLASRWNGVAGFTYLGLRREDSVTLTNGTLAEDSRQITVLEMPLGFEVSPKVFAIGRLSGFVEFGALPSLFVYGHSLDEDGHSNSGLGAYESVGALYHFGGPRFDSISLVAKAGYRERLAGDVDLDGFSALFGVRVGL